MTPKEKAKELVLKFFIVPDDALPTDSNKAWIDKPLAKACALIAVEEAIKNSFTIKEMLSRKGELDSQKLWYYIDDSAVAYWQQVKAEIEKL